MATPWLVVLISSHAYCLAHEKRESESGSATGVPQLERNQMPNWPWKSFFCLVSEWVGSPLGNVGPFFLYGLHE